MFFIFAFLWSVEPVMFMWKRFFESGEKQTVAAGDNGEGDDGGDNTTVTKMNLTNLELFALQR